MQYRNKNKIAILLPTYNGDKYLRELLDSLTIQSDNNFSVYIRDDGSKDNTLQIIKEYTSRYDFIINIASEGNLGPKYSFMKMLQLVHSEYYMFCDQDDIWLPNKIAVTYQQMLKSEREHPDIPVIVHTDLRVVDGQLNLIAESLWAFRGFNVDLPHTFNYLCHFNDITGCTMMINQLAKQACSISLTLTLPSFMYHDSLIAVMATKAGGIVVPVKQSTIIYRRHGDNETDALKFGVSILHRIGGSVQYLREQYDRYLFFQNFGYGSFVKFLFFKVRLYFLKRNALKQNTSK